MDETRPQTQKPVDKFRFLLCVLVLVSMSLSMMSRMTLNVAIVEMTNSNSTKTSQLNQEANDTQTVESVTVIEANDNKYEWSPGVQNLLIGAFYAGFAPSMLLSGRIVDLYGSKWPLFVAVLGSSFVSLLTPLVAQFNVNYLIALRFVLGLAQGSEMPGAYDMFNRWLTEGETSIFTSMTKVSFSLGTLIGASLPGLVALVGLQWPFVFYSSGLICAIWCCFWLPLASSTPQESRFCSRDELNWITRMKPHLKTEKDPAKINEQQREDTTSTSQPKIWWLIVKNPSVLALTLVKFTYNIGIDFMALELAVYLRQIHQTPIETISAIASGGPLMQMFLVTFVGWLAKYLVQRKAFGINRTYWRKIFQGSANFTIALSYLILSLIGSNQPLWLIVTLIYVVYLAWMLGAGGEAMVPYDLSPRHPATIVGVAQSVSVLSGLSVPALCGFVLGEHQDDQDRWSQLFQIIAGLMIFGGAVFVLVLKSEPFLPGEVDRSAANDNEEETEQVT